ncbi:MAG: ABC transporter ATP-binding protein [Rhodobacteraceae bacterium]|nr:ABC transporter ATP-binding protein [Paracoccaceae bacterium]
MQNIAISLEDTCLTLDGNAGPVNVLKNISLRVGKGESMGMTGPSGSGKTSLLMLLGGLERATSGGLIVLGNDLTAMNEDQLARFRMKHVGIVFQSFHLIPTMTALENVATPLELSGREAAFELAQKELDSVGLADRIDHYPSQLSGGEQQRVAIARASATEPDILLADEPTGNLDAANGEMVMELLLGLSERHNAALVLVTHAEDLAKRCDRRIKLHDGRIGSVSGNSNE